MPKIGYADQAAGLCCATDGRALQKQRAVVQAFRDSRAAIAFEKTVTEADHRAMAETASGQAQFFFERLVRAEPAGARA